MFKALLELIEPITLPIAVASMICFIGSALLGWLCIIIGLVCAT